MDAQKVENKNLRIRTTHCSTPSSKIAPRYRYFCVGGIISNILSFSAARLVFNIPLGGVDYRTQISCTGYIISPSHFAGDIFYNVLFKAHYISLQNRV